jgi:hypothetical protein
MSELEAKAKEIQSKHKVGAMHATQGAHATNIFAFVVERAGEMRIAEFPARRELS